MKKHLEKLIKKIKLRLRCLIGFHRFCVWEGKSDITDKSNPSIWFERQCGDCSFVERRDFR